MEPKIEYKNQRPTTISLLEARLSRGENAAQKMVCKLADAMVRCGYTRDATYNSRHAGFTGLRDRAVVLYWRNGKILLGRGPKRKRDGTPEKDKQGHILYPDPLHPRDWTAIELVMVAHHLPAFLDSLEGNLRWQIEQLAKATQTIQEFLDRVKADPRPSDIPGPNGPGIESREPQY